MYVRQQSAKWPIGDYAEEKNPFLEKFIKREETKAQAQGHARKSTFQPVTAPPEFLPDSDDEGDHSDRELLSVLRAPTDSDAPEGRTKRQGGPIITQKLLFISHYPVINPHTSAWLTFWDAFMAGLLAAVAIFIPFEAAFLADDTQLTLLISSFVNVCFALDIVVQFLLAYPDPQHPQRLVVLPRAIIMRYVSGWFLWDIFTICPLERFSAWAVWAIKGTPILPKTSFRVVRIVKLLRLSRFGDLVERWHTSFGYSYALLTLAKFVVVVVLCSHWMACLWGGLGCFEGESGGRTWLTALQEAKGGAQELYESPLELYTISLYWAVVTLTTIGYGDITPQTGLEYRVATLCMFVMASIWAYVIGSVCSITAALCPHEIDFKRTMDDLNWLMHDRQMPFEMRKRLRRYFHEAKDMNRQRIERNVIEQMSPLLQGEFALYLHQQWLGKVWYLREMNREIIVWAARHLTVMVFAPDEEVLAERTLFMVRRGVCALEGRILVRGDVWGEDLLLVNEQLRNPYKARALNFLEVLMLYVVDLVDVVSTYPEARARLRWAQVKIAIVRGVKLIAKTMKELRRKGGLMDVSQLTDHQYMVLIADVLRGTFDCGEFHAYFDIYDPLEELQEPVEETTDHRCTVAGRMTKHVAGDEGRSLIDNRIWLAITELNAKVDRLLPRDLRAT